MSALDHQRQRDGRRRAGEPLGHAAHAIVAGKQFQSALTSKSAATRPGVADACIRPFSFFPRQLPSLTAGGRSRRGGCFAFGRSHTSAEGRVLCGHNRWQFATPAVQFRRAPLSRAPALSQHFERQFSSAAEHVERLSCVSVACVQQPSERRFSSVQEVVAIGASHE